MGRYYNRIKVVLAERKKTNKWLAEHLEESSNGFKWNTNSAQLGVETLFSIAECLDIKVKVLLNNPVKVSD